MKSVKSMMKAMKLGKQRPPNEDDDGRSIGSIEDQGKSYRISKILGSYV